MDKKVVLLGPLEELVLLAIKALTPNAYGLGIVELITKAGGKEKNLKGLYTTLDRLQRKHLIVLAGDRSTGRLHPRKYYKLTALGENALNVVEAGRKKQEAIRTYLINANPNRFS
ncbi:MAG TPA: helix-turn-helix transcriptional regulator [Patescibacteria group bacterium]|nr:helix-turn-helix transcriptional regulator [Patescibacteria group bacterium]